MDGRKSKIKFMQEKNCAFQFAYTEGGWFGDTKIIHDQSELTLDEAKGLYEKYKPQVIKILKDKDSFKSMECVIWIDMKDKHSYGDSLIYITLDHETNGRDIWENKKEYVTV